MGKLGRIRKYSHRRYKTSNTNPKAQDEDKQNGHEHVSPNCDWFNDLPYKFQYHLRDLDNSIQPSIANFAQVFNILEKEKALGNQWNLIKHSIISDALQFLY